MWERSHYEKKKIQNWKKIKDSKVGVKGVMRVGRVLSGSVVSQQTGVYSYHRDNSLGWNPI